MPYCMQLCKQLKTLPNCQRGMQRRHCRGLPLTKPWASANPNPCRKLKALPQRRHAITQGQGGHPPSMSKAYCTRLRQSPRVTFF